MSKVCSKDGEREAGGYSSYFCWELMKMCRWGSILSERIPTTLTNICLLPTFFIVATNRSSCTEFAMSMNGSSGEIYFDEIEVINSFKFCNEHSYKRNS